MNVKKVGNVILAVRDMNKSLEFYYKILGMPIKNQRENGLILDKVVHYLVFILQMIHHHILVLQ